MKRDLYWDEITERVQFFPFNARSASVIDNIVKQSNAILLKIMCYRVTCERCLKTTWEVSCRESVNGTFQGADAMTS